MSTIAQMNSSQTAVMATLSRRTPIAFCMVVIMNTVMIPGVRKNPKMEPYSDEHVLSTQEIADIAAYLESVPIQPNTIGIGLGNELAKGQTLYLKDCAVCHGNQGVGNAKKFIPLIAGQYYKYILRELVYIQTKKRGNANPDMVKVLKPYSKEDLEAVADYVSRMPVDK